MFLIKKSKKLRIIVVKGEIQMENGLLLLSSSNIVVDSLDYISVHENNWTRFSGSKD